jgi:hypothetical protein
MKRASGGRLARLALAAAVMMLGSAMTPVRAGVLVEIDKSSQRMAVSVDGMTRYNRPRRLWHAERRVSPAIDGAELVLEEVLQFTDAARDLLLWRLRHPRHQRYLAARRTGVAWLRPSASIACRSAVRIGRTQRAAQHADRDFELTRAANARRVNRLITLPAVDEISCADAKFRGIHAAMSTRRKNGP